VQAFKKLRTLQTFMSSLYFFPTHDWQLILEYLLPIVGDFDFCSLPNTKSYLKSFFN
jgi:hypothetical protein